MSMALTLSKLLFMPGFAGRSDMLREYERCFSEIILGDGERPCLSFWRGRVALWTILNALDICQGDEVIVPAYTCEMVPAAIKFAGGLCRYCDVEQGSFNSSANSICRLITPKTKVIICQHTYGCLQDVHALADIVKASGITIIEDCCHVIDFNFQNTGVGVTGAAAFFSTQWSKPYSTGLGGMVTFSDNLLYEKVRKIRDGFPHEVASRQAWKLAMQFLIYTLAVRPMTRSMIAETYRWAQRTGLVKGTTALDEYGDIMPSDYLAGACNTQAAIGLNQLQKWRNNVKHRMELTGFYLENLTKIGVDTSHLCSGAGERALWSVPLLVDNKQEILDRASRSGLPIATWFGRLPVHISAGTAGRYDYIPGQCPQSEQLFMREIHLLTDSSVNLRHAKAAIEMLKKIACFAF